MGLHLRRKALTVLLPALLLPAVASMAAQKVTIRETPFGTVTADHATAAEGTTVVLTVTPSKGYQLEQGSLVVEKTVDSEESDHADHQSSRQGVPDVAIFVSVTQTGADTYSFIMPETSVEVRATFVRTSVSDIEIKATLKSDPGQAVDGVTAQCSLNSDGSATVTAITVPEWLRSTGIIVFLPPSVTLANGENHEVAAIASHALHGLTCITDVHLPDTQAPILIGNEAFRVDNLQDATHRIVCIHVPLPLLDDYALMPSLHENYWAFKIQATAKAAHRYWTFSCGVDVLVPAGVRPHICTAVGNDAVSISVIRDATVIKANNGVLMDSTDNSGHDYDMTASPCAERPSGMVPPTHNARTYAGNLLEPVIESTHYDHNSRYILAGNAFHDIIQEPAAAKVPACKAVLHLPADAVTGARVIRIAENASNGIPLP